MHAGERNLLYDFGSVLTPQVDDWDVFAFGDFIQTGTLRFRSHVTFWQVGVTNSRGNNLCIHGERFNIQKIEKELRGGVLTVRTRDTESAVAVALFAQMNMSSVFTLHFYL